MILELTADDGVQFSVAASDAESNPIPTDAFTWAIDNEAGTSTDIGDALRAAGLGGTPPWWATTP